MEKLNEKLYNSFLNNDRDKINKYLLKGAEPTTHDNELYRYAAANDDDCLLNILLQFNKTTVLTDKGIMTLACMYNSVKCIKILCNIINRYDYKRTPSYDIIQKIIYV